MQDFVDLLIGRCLGLLGWIGIAVGKETYNSNPGAFGPFHLIFFQEIVKETPIVTLALRINVQGHDELTYTTSNADSGHPGLDDGRPQHELGYRMENSHSSKPCQVTWSFGMKFQNRRLFLRVPLSAVN